MGPRPGGTIEPSGGTATPARVTVRSSSSGDTDGAALCSDVSSVAFFPSRRLAAAVSGSVPNRFAAFIRSRLYVPFSISRRMRPQYCEKVLYRLASVLKRKRCPVFRICSLRKIQRRLSMSFRWFIGSTRSMPMKYWS